MLWPCSAAPAELSIASARTSLLAAVRLRIAPAAVRPGPQPRVVEPAPEQLAAIDDPSDADQPGLQDQDGAQRAVTDCIAGHERLEDQAGEEPQTAQAQDRRHRARHRRQV